MVESTGIVVLMVGCWISAIDLEGAVKGERFDEGSYSF